MHRSKVRSLTLDSWEPELLKVRTPPAPVAAARSRLPPRRSSRNDLRFVSVVDVRARERRGQPHLRRFGPGGRPEEAAALQLTVRPAPAPSGPSPS